MVSVVVLQQVWKGGRCTFNACAHSLKGAVLGNIFHPLWCRASRLMSPVVLIYQTRMFTHCLGSKLLRWQLCLSGIGIAITKEAQNSASVFTVVIILQFALNQESSLTRDVQ